MGKVLPNGLVVDEASNVIAAVLFPGKNKTKDNQIKDVGPKRILASRQRMSHKRTD
jgi:hypothetical protein